MADKKVSELNPILVGDLLDSDNFLITKDGLSSNKMSVTEVNKKYAQKTNFDAHEASKIAHEQRDTKANLDLWAVGKTNGSEAYGTDTDKKYYVVNDLLVETGSTGGAVDSVNGQTGVVVLSTANISDSTNKRYVTDAEKVDIADIQNKVVTVVAGTGVAVDNTDPQNPIVSSVAVGGVSSVNGLTGAVSLTTALIPEAIDSNYVSDAELLNIIDIPNKLDSVVAGRNISVDVTDPVNPVVATSNIEGIQGTGVLSGGLISIGVPTSTVTITAGVGMITDYHTDPLNPVTIRRTWTEFTNELVVNLAVTNATYFGINSLGSLVQQAVPFTTEQHRDIIDLGFAIHTGNTEVESVSSNVNFLGSLGNQFEDLSDVIGPINKSGNVYIYNGTNLNINKDSGLAYGRGINYSISRKSPNIKIQSAGTALTFLRTFFTGTEWSYVQSNLIDPNNRDSLTGLIAVGTNKWTIQRINLDPRSDITVIQYGQAEFNNLAEAEAGIFSEVFTSNPELVDVMLRGWILVKQGATDLSNIAQAKFVSANKFGTSAAGGSTSATTTLQRAYENSLPSPEISLNSTQGGLDIRDNSTPLGTDLHSVSNFDGTVKYFGVSAIEVALNQLGFTVGTGKVNSTAGNNISITDSDGTSVLRKERKLLFIEDFKETVSSAFFDSKSASITIASETVLNLQGHTSLKLTQLTASTNDFATMSTGQDITKEMQTYGLLGLEALTSFNGVTGDQVLYVEFNNGTDWTTIPRQEYDIRNGTKSNRFLFNVPDTATLFRIGVRIVTANDTHILYLDDIAIIGNPLPTAEFVESVYVSGQGNGGGPTTPLVTDIDFTEVSDSSNSFDGTTFTAPFSASYDIDGGIKHATAVGGVSVYAYINGVQDIELGYAAPVSAIHRFSGTVYLERGEQLTLRDNNGSALANDTSRHVLSITAQATSSNVVSEGATSEQDTLSTYTPTFYGFGTVSTHNMKWSRIGTSNYIRVVGTFVSGTMSGTTYGFSLPNNYTSDSNITPFVPMDEITFSDNRGGVQVYTTVDASSNIIEFWYHNDATSYLKIVDTAPLPIAGTTYYVSAIVPVNELKASDVIYSIPQSTIEPTVTKILSANHNTVADITGLTFTGLEIGQEYEVSAQFQMDITTTNNQINFMSGAGNTGEIYGVFAAHIGAGADDKVDSKSFKFIASSTSLYLYHTATVLIYGDGTKSSSFIQLTKRNKSAFIANVAKVNHITGGTEYETGELLNGQKVYARSYTGLLPSGTLLVSGASRLVAQYGTIDITGTVTRPIPYSVGTGTAWVELNKTTGAITMSSNITYYVDITIEYTY